MGIFPGLCRNGISGSYDKPVFNFSRNCQTVFFLVDIPFYITCQQWYGSFHILANICYRIGCEVVYLIVVLMSSFLITYGVEHLSMLLIGRLYYLQYFSLRLGVYLTDIFVLHEGSSDVELKDVTHFKIKDYCSN